MKPSSAFGSIPINRILMVMSGVALVWALVARSLGPSDLWDQTQPRTVSCTTDLVVNGGQHWFLPIERGELPATKPPLYNWLAAPAVRLLGFDSEIAHKMPSIVALCLCWLVVVRLGRSIDDEHGGALGSWAGAALVTNYGMFKLGFLARPDMLLTLWLLLAWVLGTGVIMHPARSGARAAGFWLCIALAGLTKGPAAIVGVVSMVPTALAIGGSWARLRAFRPLLGCLFCLVVMGAWAFAVARIDATHLREQLLFQEVLGRFSGVGHEGRGFHGIPEYLISLPLQGFYFLTHFFPWSLPCLAGLVLVTRKFLRDDAYRFTDHRKTEQWMRSATIFAVVTVGLFSLSVGKRADYIAIAFPQGSLLAAWWLLRTRSAVVARLAPIAVILTLTALTIHNQLAPVHAVKGFGEEILRFAQDANRRIAAEPLPVVHCWSGETHLLALMGAAREDSRDRLMSAIKTGQPFWLVAGRKGTRPEDVGQWLEQVRKVSAEPVLRTPMMPHQHGWRGQATLFRVSPRIVQSIKSD